MGLLDGIQFLQQSFKHKSAVGAVWPSSKALCRAMAEPVFRNDERPLRILEVGAGTGPVTNELVARLETGDSLDCVELNPEFCVTLRKRFADAPIRPTVHEVSILDYTAAP